jgi:hypothetical protein
VVAEQRGERRGDHDTSTASYAAACGPTGGQRAGAVCGQSTLSQLTMGPAEGAQV